MTAAPPHKYRRLHFIEVAVQAKVVALLELYESGLDGFMTGGGANHDLRLQRKLYADDLSFLMAWGAYVDFLTANDSELKNKLERLRKRSRVGVERGMSYIAQFKCGGP